MESQTQFLSEENAPEDKSVQSSFEITRSSQRDTTEPLPVQYRAFRAAAQERLLISLREQVTQHLDAWRSMQKPTPSSGPEETAV